MSVVKEKLSIKHCTRCNTYQTIDKFYKNDLSCIICRHEKQNEFLSIDNTKEITSTFPDFDLTENREKYFADKRDVSLERIHFLIARQNYKCAICEVNLDTLKQHQIHIDHDHETGKTRGILCQFCNTGLGFFKDNISVLENSIQYLIMHGKSLLKK